MAVAGPPFMHDRPRTTPAPGRHGGGNTRRSLHMDRRAGSREGYANRDLHDVMEKDYEWPELPPIEQIKDAISRQRVSQGVSYILPVDRTKCSVENVYRTNLRGMFQEPYTAERPGDYDEQQVRVSTRHHFQPNAVLAPYRRIMHTDPRHYQVNADSELVRQNYARSAPSTGLAARRSLTNSELKQRSNLYLPLKAKMPEEAKKLKEEAAKILQSVQEKDEEYDPSRDKVVIPRKGGEEGPQHHRDRPARGDRKGPAARRVRLTGHRDLAPPNSPPRRTEMFTSYDALKSTSVPRIKTMPDYVQELAFLTMEKKTDIWSWLNTGDEQTDFSYFLEICT